MYNIDNKFKSDQRKQLFMPCVVQKPKILLPNMDISKAGENEEAISDNKFWVNQKNSKLLFIHIIILIY